MGEIRSTMDIIMEKAKGLTMSEEEKETFRKKETEGKVRGFLQRFLDGFIDAERLKDEIGSLGEERYAIASNRQEYHNTFDSRMGSLSLRFCHNAPPWQEIPLPDVLAAQYGHAAQLLLDGHLST